MHDAFFETTYRRDFIIILIFLGNIKMPVAVRCYIVDVVPCVIQKLKRVQYRMADILAVGGFVNAMQRQCNVVGLANFAQTINVVGMLFVTDDAVIKEPVYWPLYLARRFSGDVSVDNYVVCDGYNTYKNYRGSALKIKNVPYLDCSTTVSKEGNKLYVCMINRHIDEEMTTEISILQNIRPQTVTLHELWHENPFAMNTPDNPENIVPLARTMDIPSNKFELVLKPHSYTIAEIDL